jgi:hypothetical protein
MTKFLNAFVKDEDGAVSIDWVVLTAAIVAMQVARSAAPRPPYLATSTPTHSRLTLLLAQLLRNSGVGRA